ncbi:MAG: carboxypeptidase-like regulatory domain-containing protein [Alistipes onderdonkii]
MGHRQGTTTGTSTGSDGSYSLNVKDGNATLVCSFIGMKSAEAAVNGRTEVNFALEADAIGLEEVIAIGYGTIRKEEITSSITRVSSDEFYKEASAIRFNCFRKSRRSGYFQNIGQSQRRAEHHVARYFDAGSLFGSAYRDRRGGRRVPQRHFTGKTLNPSMS